jgi:shikimate kinase
MNDIESSSYVPDRTIVLTGMMGVGKSSVGRKLAARLGVPFFDSDAEIEQAAGMTVAEFFKHYGETEFRKGERRVISRLLQGPAHVLSTGGGAFMDEETRALIDKKAISIWLKADHAIILERAMRRNNRPLLQGGDPRQKLADLLVSREPVYATADITVESNDRPVDETVDRVVKALHEHAHKFAGSR